MTTIAQKNFGTFRTENKMRGREAGRNKLVTKDDSPQYEDYAHMCLGAVDKKK